jgi:hypothetical protein
MAGPDRQEKAMSMNHDLTIRLARDRQRQMLAQASHRQRHQPRRLAPQTPRTATRIVRGLAAAVTGARVAAGLRDIPAAPRWVGTDARKS